jgi:hypothetical protein
MSTVEADLIAVRALKEYLLRALPAKVTTLNAVRAAVVKAGKAGNYTVSAGMTLQVGTGRETLTQVPLTAGARTAAQVAAEIDAAVAGVTATADSLGRVVITADNAPVEGTESCVVIGPDNLGASSTATGVNRLFGWNEQGTHCLRSALVAPDTDAVSESSPGHYDLGRSMWVVMGRRAVEPRENIRSDVYRVAIAAEILVAEPTGDMRAAVELAESAARAVREVVTDDRTLDGVVHLTELPSLVQSAETFRFAAAGGSSPLMGVATQAFRIHVFERS